MSNLIIQRIEGRLAALGLTARAASMQAGLGADGIRNILRGKSANPRGQTLVKLAEVLQCSLGYLAGEDGEVAGPPSHANATPEDMKLRRLVVTRLAYWRSAMTAADALDISLNDLHGIETGAIPLDDAFIMKFASVTRAPLDWLLLGRIREPMKAELAARIALFDPGLVSDALEEAQTPEEAREMASRNKNG